jgi:hypothetical protein
VTIFYDSTDPEKIPAGARACLYADGDFASGRADLGRFYGVRWITVLGNQWAQIADFEKGNEVFSEGSALLGWARGMCHQGVRPVVYSDVASLGLVRQRLATLDRPYDIWLATLDGDKLSAGYEGLPVWAVQYEGGETAPYDTSVLYGTW